MSKNLLSKGADCLRAAGSGGDPKRSTDTVRTQRWLKNLVFCEQTQLLVLSERDVTLCTSKHTGISALSFLPFQRLKLPASKHPVSCNSEERYLYLWIEKQWPAGNNYEKPVQQLFKKTTCSPNSAPVCPCKSRWQYWAPLAGALVCMKIKLFNMRTQFSPWKQ